MIVADQYWTLFVGVLSSHEKRLEIGHGRSDTARILLSTSSGAFSTHSRCELVAKASARVAASHRLAEGQSTTLVYTHFFAGIRNAIESP